MFFEQGFQNIDFSLLCAKVIVCSILLQDTYEEIKAIRERGFELIEGNHYSKSSIKLRCDEIRKQCDDFQDALETRESTLQTNVDVFKCLDQVFVDDCLFCLLCITPIDHFHFVA